MKARKTPPALGFCCAFGLLVLVLSGCGTYMENCSDNDGDLMFAEAGCGTLPDCDDNDPAVNPGAVEGPPDDPTCADSIDNDCDGTLDGEDLGCMVSCVDNDGDGYGDPGNLTCRFSATDCDDSDPNVNPGMIDIPGNGIDDDCNPATPLWGTPVAIILSENKEPSDIANTLLLLIVSIGAVLVCRRMRRKK